jgi:hypothetical protein
VSDAIPSPPRESELWASLSASTLRCALACARAEERKARMGTVVDKYARTVLHVVRHADDVRYCNMGCCDDGTHVKGLLFLPDSTKRSLNMYAIILNGHLRDGDIFLPLRHCRPWVRLCSGLAEGSVYVSGESVRRRA